MSRPAAAVGAAIGSGVLVSGTGPLGWLALDSAAVPPGDDWLSPAERLTLASLRFHKRRADWRLGRWTAKRVILDSWRAWQSGSWPVSGDGPFSAEAAVSIEAAADGAPEVFISGVPPSKPFSPSVSISHSAGRGLAVVGSKQHVFGGDLETIEPRSESFVEDIATLRERAWMASIEEAHRPWAATLLWSAKEAVLKALRTGLREDTRSVEITVPSGAPAHLVASASSAAAPRLSSSRKVSALVLATGQIFEGRADVLRGQVVTILRASPCGLGAPPRPARSSE